MKPGNDPRWQEFAVSLRRGITYIKMPLASARLIISVLTRVATGKAAEPYTSLLKLRTFLYGELLASNELSKMIPQHCLFYSQAAGLTISDAKLLREVQEQDETNMLRAFASALEKGAEGDLDLDWISRVGGPSPNSPLEGLVRENEPAEILDLTEVLE